MINHHLRLEPWVENSQAISRVTFGRRFGKQVVKETLIPTRSGTSHSPLK